MAYKLVRNVDWLSEMLPSGFISVLILAICCLLNLLNSHHDQHSPWLYEKRRGLKEHPLSNVKLDFKLQNAMRFQ